MPSYENLYNNSAERYVLGSILIDNNVINGVSGKLDIRDFYNEDNRKVYEAMLNLFKRDSNVELLLVIDEFISKILIGKKDENNNRQVKILWNFSV